MITIADLELRRVKIWVRVRFRVRVRVKVWVRVSTTRLLRIMVPDPGRRNIAFMVPAPAGVTKTEAVLRRAAVSGKVACSNWNLIRHDDQGWKDMCQLCLFVRTGSLWCVDSGGLGGAL